MSSSAEGHLTSPGPRASGSGGRASSLLPAVLLAAVLASWPVQSARADDGYSGDEAAARDDLPGDAYDDDADDDEPATSSRPSDSHEQDESSLQAGGLTAPTGLSEEGDTKSEIERELDEADRRDSGRGLHFVWLSADVGISHVGLAAVSDDDLAPGAVLRGTGASFGGGLGVRVLYFTLGGRFRMTPVDDFETWSLLGEAGLRIPIGKLEPFAQLGVGFVAVSGLSTQGAQASVPDLRGTDLRMSGGADYFLSDYVSVGAELAGDLLILNRPADPQADSSSSFSVGGSGVGAGVSLLLRFGVHF